MGAAKAYRMITGGKPGTDASGNDCVESFSRREFGLRFLSDQRGRRGGGFDSSLVYGSALGGKTCTKEVQSNLDTPKPREERYVRPWKEGA